MRTQSPCVCSITTSVPMRSFAMIGADSAASSRRLTTSPSTKAPDKTAMTAVQGNIRWIIVDASEMAPFGLHANLEPLVDRAVAHPGMTSDQGIRTGTLLWPLPSPTWPHPLHPHAH